METPQAPDVWFPGLGSFGEAPGGLLRSHQCCAAWEAQWRQRPDLDALRGQHRSWASAVVTSVVHLCQAREEGWTDRKRLRGVGSWGCSKVNMVSNGRTNMIFGIRNWDFIYQTAFGPQMRGSNLPQFVGQDDDQTLNRKRMECLFSLRSLGGWMVAENLKDMYNICTRLRGKQRSCVGSTIHVHPSCFVQPHQAVCTTRQPATLVSDSQFWDHQCRNLLDITFFSCPICKHLFLGGTSCTIGITSSPRKQPTMPTSWATAMGSWRASWFGLQLHTTGPRMASMMVRYIWCRWHIWRNSAALVASMMSDQQMNGSRPCYRNWSQSFGWKIWELEVDVAGWPSSSLLLLLGSIGILIHSDISDDTLYSKWTWC